MNASDYQYVKLKSEPGDAVQFDLEDRIIGEVLPDHEQDGEWLVDRIEDTAFLAEAYAERIVTRKGSLVIYEGDTRMFSAINHIVPNVTSIFWSIAVNIYDELRSGIVTPHSDYSDGGCWCGDFSNSVEDMSDATGKGDPGVAWPSIYPSTQMSVSWLNEIHQSVRRPWVADDLRHVYADLSAYGSLVVADEATYSGIEHIYGGSRPFQNRAIKLLSFTQYHPYYGLETAYDEVSSVNLNAPAGATGGKMAILYSWRIQAEQGGAEQSGTGWKVLDLDEGPSLVSSKLSVDFMTGLIPGYSGASTHDAQFYISHAYAFYSMDGMRTALTQTAQ